MARALSIIIFFCIALVDSHSQVQKARFLYSCSVIDSLSGKPLAFCHIYNETQRRGMIADTNGWFSTRVSAGDTLVFIALGYLGETYRVEAKDTIHQQLRLRPRTYEIEPVTIGIPRTYSEFKEAVMKVDPNKDKPLKDLPKNNPYIRDQDLDTNRIYRPMYTVMHPVSGLYYRFSKVEKSKREVSYLEEQALKQPEVDKKYNRELVAEITGFSGESRRPSGS